MTELEEYRARFEECEHAFMAATNTDDREEIRKEWKQVAACVKYLKTPEKFYNDKYYKRHFEDYRVWEVRLGTYFAEKYEIESVLDLGCGVGSYLEGFIRGGADKICGVELCYDQIEPYIIPILHPFIFKGDVTKISDLPISGTQYDCAFSIEVAEHLLPEKTDLFIEHLAASTDRKIIFTAAKPGQPGTGHINCRPKEEWIDMVTAHGFVHEKEETANDVEVIKLLGAPKYIQNNLMVFTRK